MRTITIAPFAGSIAEHSDPSPRIINKIIKKSAPKIIAGLLGTLVWNAFLVRLPIHRRVVTPAKPANWSGQP